MLYYKPRYIKRSKISEPKFCEILRFFVLDLTAVQVAEITNFSRNTITNLFTKFRRRIFEICERTSPVAPEKEEFEADESDFDATMLKENPETLSPILRKRADIKSVIHTDG